MKILIVKTSSLGDILHAFPVLDFFSTYYPQAQVDWVAEKAFAPIVVAHSAVHHVFFLESKVWRKTWWTRGTWKAFRSFREALRGESYDVVFDLQGNTKSALVTALARSQHKVGLGRKAVAEWPNLLVTNHRYTPPAGENIRKEGLYLVQEYLKDHRMPPEGRLCLQLDEEQKEILRLRLRNLPLDAEKVFLVCPGSQWPNKRLSFSQWVELLVRVLQHYPVFFGIVWGTEEDRRAAESIAERCSPYATLIEKMPLPVLQRLMGCVDGVLAMDSLPLHLAATAGTPTWSVFGPSLGKKYAPTGDSDRHIQGSCPYGRTFAKRCPILRSCPTGSCVKDLTVEQLFADIETWICFLNDINDGKRPKGQKRHKGQTT